MSVLRLRNLAGEMLRPLLSLQTTETICLATLLPNFVFVGAFDKSLRSEREPWH